MSEAIGALAVAVAKRDDLGRLHRINHTGELISRDAVVPATTS
jgi:hypothetical protein